MASYNNDHDQTCVATLGAGNHCQLLLLHGDQTPVDTPSSSGGQGNVVEHYTGEECSATVVATI